MAATQRAPRRRFPTSGRGPAARRPFALFAACIVGAATAHAGSHEMPDPVREESSLRELTIASHVPDRVQVESVETVARARLAAACT